ncbi:MAG: nitroreductase family protein [Planctomycetes bacterium]|nr:nitroreductase family protein [Planctomycetota bacterium]
MKTCSVMRFALLACLLLEDSPALEGRLPAPKGLDMPLGEALRRRASTRRFDPSRPLARDELGTLLWAMAGVTRPDPSHPHGGRRAAPSAYEAYAIDVLVTGAEGTFTYSPKDHALVPHPALGKKDLRAEVPRTDWVKEAPLLVVLVADLGRYPEHVRAERRRDYSYADAAAMGENLYLAAAALGLGTVLTADARPEAGEVLGLKEGQHVAFIMPVGRARP